MINEILSNEQLDNVNGSSIGETALDSSLLYAYGLVDDWHSDFTTLFNWSDYSAAVRRGWEKAGIKCETNKLFANKYYKNGTEITEQQAYDYIEANYKQVHFPKS